MVLELINLKMIGIGRIKVISTSKMRKITAMRKNRRENGTRADLLGSNPHSKAEGFSRSKTFFMAIVEFNAIKATGKIKDKTIMLKIISITEVIFLIGS